MLCDRSNKPLCFFSMCRFYIFFFRLIVLDEEKPVPGNGIERAGIAKWASKGHYDEVVFLRFLLTFFRFFTSAHYMRLPRGKYQKPVLV